MSECLVPLQPSGQVALFEPSVTVVKDAKADALIEFAKRVRDWPLLERAVKQKLDEQAEFVAWWRENVSVNRGAGRGNKKTAERQSFSLEEAEEHTGIKGYQVTRWARRLEDIEAYSAALYGAMRAKGMAESNAIAGKWTGNPENYTPSQYVEAARRTMGGIDLDPASNSLAQETVKAATWYNEADNGLAHGWKGRVFLNPPYSHPEITNFVEKLCSEVSAGNVSAAVLLTNNNTDTSWWHTAAKASASVCLTRGRISFYTAGGVRTQPTNGQSFFYFGSDPDLFKGEFEEFGLIMAVVA